MCLTVLCVLNETFLYWIEPTFVKWHANSGSLDLAFKMSKWSGCTTYMDALHSTKHVAHTRPQIIISKHVLFMLHKITMETALPTTFQFPDLSNKPAEHPAEHLAEHPAEHPAEQPAAQDS